MSKVLLGYTAIGPTYKDRVVYHIKKYEEHYKYFDILILTDDPEYFKFGEIKHFSNVIIEDLNKHREQFPEFLEYEKLVEEKISNSIYRNQIVELSLQGFYFPLHLQRFILNYENLDQYQGIIMLDCDVAPVIDENGYEKFVNYFDRMPINSVSSNKCYYTWEDRPKVKDFIYECISELGITNQKDLSVVDGFDNPLKLLKFEGIEKARSFFNMWNYCLLKSFKSKDRDFLIPRAWGDASEVIISILYTLENIKVNKDNIDYNIMNYFRSYTYPEDRFWNDVTCLNFNISSNSKEEFIKVNYEKLKEFYKNYHQEFPYE